MADLIVYSTIGVRSAAEQLFVQFEKASGQKLAATWGTAPMLVKRIEDGNTADVVVLSRAGIEALQKQGKIAPGTDTRLASSGCRYRRQSRHTEARHFHTRGAQAHPAQC
jgi:molybdate transport system substrate-binding protein